MANKWAIANGNWSNGSTWNDGVVPTANDVVYLNNHLIDLNGTVIASAKEIRNDSIEGVNPNGSLQLTDNSIITINADIYAYYTIITPYNVQRQTCIINGNVYVSTIDSNSNSKICFNLSINRTQPTVIINGNIEVEYGTILGTSGISSTDGASYTINGNIKENHLQHNVGSLIGLFGNYQLSPKMLVNGNIDAYTNVFPQYTSLTNFQYAFEGPIEITGKYTARGMIAININKFKCSKFEYVGKFPFNLFYIYPDDNIEINCIDDPNTNAYLFVNKNFIYQTYPQESKVEKGIIYGPNNEFEGTFEIDYPQEANVLKNVEYDNGNKVGTLEVIALSGATATAENLAVINLTEQEVNRVKNCATVETVQKCFEDFREE